MSLFDYKTEGPIHEEGHAFRLLRLVHGKDREIKCHLFKAYIHKSGEGMPYEALSYVWGSTERTEHITVNGKSFMVTRNLFEALQHLRLDDEDRILWIDAICIDQSFMKERNHQVVHMAAIFREADGVVFWLGRSSYETDLLMGALKTLENHSNKMAYKDWPLEDRRWKRLWIEVALDESIRAQYRSGLQIMLQRPWFTRAWILQECAHAKIAVVACGKKSVAARIFVVAPYVLGLKPEPHCQALLDIMPGFPRQGWWSKQRDLYTLLLKFKNATATEQHDKVFALLSMATDVEATGFPRIDYTMSLQELYDTTFFFLFPYNWARGPPNTSFSTFFEFVEYLPQFKNTTIVEAIEEGQEDLVKSLTTGSTFDPEFADVNGFTALSKAADKGHSGIIKHLLGLRNVNMNAMDARGRLPLSIAVRKQDVAAVQLLSEHNTVDINAIDESSSTPLALAACLWK